jgi:hypothetical protein
MSTGRNNPGSFSLLLSLDFNLWIFSRKCWGCDYFKCAFSRFTQQRLYVFLTLATGLQSIIINIQEPARYLAFLNVMFRAWSFPSVSAATPQRTERVSCTTTNYGEVSWTHKGTMEFHENISFGFRARQSNRRHPTWRHWLLFSIYVRTCLKVNTVEKIMKRSFISNLSKRCLIVYISHK